MSMNLLVDYHLVVVCLVLFVVGAIQDYGSALFLNLANSKRHGWASLLSIVHTLVSYLIWFKLGESFLSGDIIPLVVYCVAGGLGTFVGLKHNVSGPK